MINIKKRKALSINQKYAIVTNEENLTTSHLAKKYEVADSTIYTIKKSKENIIQHYQVSIFQHQSA